MRPRRRLAVVVNVENESCVWAALDTRVRRQGGLKTAACLGHRRRREREGRVQKLGHCGASVARGKGERGKRLRRGAVQRRK